MSAAELAGLGPFFDVELHQAGSEPVHLWHPLSDLVEQPAVVETRVADLRAVLAARGHRRPEQVEARVAASVAHTGLVTRLVLPAFALAVCTGDAPDLDLASMWWQQTWEGAFALSLCAHAGEEGQVSLDGAAFGRRLRFGAIGQVTDVFAASVSISRQVLWGNVGSAINSAALRIMLKRPESSNQTRQFAADAMAELPSTSAPASSAWDAPGRDFRRPNCCLIYRATADRGTSTRSVCADCVLAP